MSPERWRAARDLFEQALETPAEQRRRWILERCGEDRELGRAVLELLDSDDRAGSFLGDLLAEPAGPPPGGTEGATVVGSYRLLRKLGEGGMGSVYAAVKDDGSVDREVVVKLVRGEVDDARTRRRLRTERRILATLEHPNIARLYDSGTTAAGPDGGRRPYFVMELVEGLPIDVDCDRKRLTVDQRLRLFRKVCAAVHYAHQHLVVHRDLKPNNILVTAEGEPKLLDFGIAKLLDAEPGTSEAVATVPWSRWLTPDYASPEQILGRPLTTASDVYSLGVLLCRLLVGVLPRSLGGLSAAEVERALTEAVPVRPSTLLARLAGRPAEGEASAAAGGSRQSPSAAEVAGARHSRPPQLASRLAGDLDTIVLEALSFDPGRRYASAQELSEDLSRHLRGFPVVARPDSLGYRLGKFVRRHRLGLTVASAFCALLVAGGVALAMQSARVARERDQLRAVVRFVKEVFKVAAEGEELTVRQAVDRSAAILERQLTEQPEARATLIDATGTIYLHLWAVEQARSQLERAVEIRARLHGETSPQVAESLSTLGLAETYLGDAATGEDRARRALQIAREIYGERHQELVRPLNNLVSVQCYASDFEAAEAPSEAALTLARELLPGTHEELARAIGNRALVLTKADRLAEATALYREALALHRRSMGEEHPAIAEIANNLAIVLKRQERFDEAEELYRQAAGLERRLFGEDSSKLSVTLNNLGALQLVRQDFVASVETYREARDLAVRSLGPRHPGALITTAGLASALIASGDAPAAEALLAASLDGWREELGGSWLVAYAESVLGESLTRQERFREAEALLVRSYPEILRARGERDAKTRDAHRRLVDLFRASKQPEKLAEIEASAPEATASTSGS